MSTSNKSEAGSTSDEDTTEAELEPDAQVPSSDQQPTSNAMTQQRRSWMQGAQPITGQPSSLRCCCWSLSCAQELLKAVVALKQLHKENRKLSSNFDNVSGREQAIQLPLAAAGTV